MVPSGHDKYHYTYQECDDVIITYCLCDHYVRLCIAQYCLRQHALLHSNLTCYSTNIVVVVAVTLDNNQLVSSLCTYVQKI